MTKTLAFSWIFSPESGGGGIERVTTRLIEGLSERGYRCHFLLHDIENGRFRLDDDEDDDMGELLNRHKVDTLVNQNGYSSHVTDVLQQASGRCRYIVCHHNEPLYLRKIFDIRGVIARFCARDLPLSDRLAWFARFLIYPLWDYLSTRKISETQTRNYILADQYIVLSPSFLPQLSKLLKRPEIPKALAIPNPLSFEIGRSEYIAPEKAKEVLIVARLNDFEKRISAALKAWRIVEAQDQEGWTLKIVGDGPDAEALEKMMKDFGLKRVCFLGRQDPLPHYETAAIFLMTSRVEGWGVTLTEAMQNRAVPIAFDAYASLHDIVDHGKTGLIVRNGDIDALAKATLQLMLTPDSVKILAEKALASVNRYRLDAVLDQWEAIL